MSLSGVARSATKAVDELERADQRAHASVRFHVLQACSHTGSCRGCAKSKSWRSVGSDSRATHAGYAEFSSLSLLAGFYELAPSQFATLILTVRKKLCAQEVSTCAGAAVDDGFTRMALQSSRAARTSDTLFETIARGPGLCFQFSQ